MLDSHREAAANYITAIEYSEDLSAEKKLELYEGRYNECNLTAQLNEAIKACEEIQEIMEDLNDPLQLGENYRKLSGLLVQAGDNSKAIEYIEKTIGILENLPPSIQLAMAYCSQSYTYIATEKPYLSIE